MNGAILLIPLLLIRYGLLWAIDRNALRRAAHFPPAATGERWAFLLYQLSTVLLIGGLCFLTIKTGSPFFPMGLTVYGVGALLLTLATVHFAKPSERGVNRNGLYRLSRNPMYLSYFVYFLGCVLLTRSPVLFLFLLILQISSHWLILAEERWCQAAFGEEYAQYAQSVRRYL